MRNLKLTLSNGKKLLFTLLRFDVKTLLLVKPTIWCSFFINTIAPLFLSSISCLK